MRANISPARLEEIQSGIAANLRDTLRKKALKAGRPMQDVDIYLEYSVTIGPRPGSKSSLSERVASISSSITWYIKAKMERFQALHNPNNEMTASVAVPEEIVAIQLASLENDYAMQRKSAAMTPEQQEARIEELVYQLRGKKGFAEYAVLGPAPSHKASLPARLKP